MLGCGAEEAGAGEAGANEVGAEGLGSTFHQAKKMEFGVHTEACVSWLCPYRNVGFVFATYRNQQFGALYCKSETLASNLKHPRINDFGLILVGKPIHEVLTSAFLIPEIQASDF